MVSKGREGGPAFIRRPGGAVRLGALARTKKLILVRRK